MCHVTKSNDWRELFDVIVCSARKPTFYSEVNRLVNTQIINNGSPLKNQFLCTCNVASGVAAEVGLLGLWQHLPPPPPPKGEKMLPNRGDQGLVSVS